ncbi:MULTISPECIES: ABC transporter ATP-binding protein [Nitrosomonas]|uniref:ABC transporter ATP-binding protein n=1 Tax=Nitrosomonas communis TaxID=44574 RepID=A0A0F7KKH7_9PROT|nr:MULTISPECIES: ABC transporter ATP-binding protein [Nitrosomonas]AKH39302.1 ABC transporter ATP-binding protein [Nitrosomonas communis]TYP90859.1 peptide/nickel transport system ATP-binding protein [Nitrosomonas communis]UVS61525.1 ABC transporter ATP-binding protein [Nitrosomonas sp. PLL12]
MMPLLEIAKLKTVLNTGSAPIHAVDGLELKIFKGETFALLGESGCGKSMTALSIMRLLPEIAEIIEGHIKLDGNDLLLLPETDMRKVRGKRISMIFQEPMLSLNPVMTIASQIKEVLKQHFILHHTHLHKRILELLQQVGIPDAPRRMTEFPFQFSGGMKQRVMIAMALAGEPELLIADEPTTALDVTIQAQVLDLMRDLQQRTHMAILLITHDLGVVAEIAHRIAVMYAGEIIETATCKDFFQQPAHPYSQKLFAALPERAKRNQGLAVISGNVPLLSQAFQGCRFAERCDHAWELCRQTVPEWIEITPGHRVKCHLFSKEKRSEYQVNRTEKQTTSSVETYQPTHHQDSALLNVTNLKIHFPIYQGLLRHTAGYVKAVDGISLTITSGKTLALVGESGCGKTTVGKGICLLIPVTEGSVQFNGSELTGLPRHQLRKKRTEFQIIFQDPYSSLNPRMRIIDILEEGMNALTPDDPHRIKPEQPLSSYQKENRIDELLQRVGLPPEAKWRYPHEFSGGQRQRIAIARALAVNPKLLICDEPTSALDVSVQAQILNLLRTLQQNLGLAYLFITHNISVVEYLADEVAVMYLGRIVEKGYVDEILNTPKHPYTQALLSSVPAIEATSKRPNRTHLKGELPSPANTPSGCYFHPRCPYVMPICRKIYPEKSTFSPTHSAHCYLYSQNQNSA